MNKRNLAIDMLRGLTMVLMVFVNDLWTIHDAPHILEHAATWEDGMGLSDLIYPMFLFAMGMSIPYAIDRRYEKGYSTLSTLGHILLRTMSLILMGMFIYNGEARDLGIYKGALYENMVAEALSKSGYPLYYYKREVP